jgi:hypothetical protein
MEHGYLYRCLRRRLAVTVRMRRSGFLLGARQARIYAAAGSRLSFGQAAEEGRSKLHAVLIQRNSATLDVQYKGLERHQTTMLGYQYVRFR